MTIQISCSALAFTAQKARKLLVSARIEVYQPSNIPDGAQCRVRVSFISSLPVAGVFSIQDIPGMWTAVNPPGAPAVVESTQVFNPNSSLPVFTAFPSFFDPNNPTAPTPPPGYSANYRVQVFDNSNIYGDILFVLSGTAIAQQSVDVVFALDHGSSMNSSVVTPNRIERLKSAFPRAVALLRGDDRLGVTSFANKAFDPTGVDPTLNPQLLSGNANFTHRELATGLCTNLFNDTSAPALKSLQLATDLARSLSPTATVILVTDGAHVGRALPQPTLPTSAMIIGDVANQVPALATQMVSVDGRYAYASTQALGDFAIEKLLTQLLIGLAGSQYISDPEGALGPGRSQSFPLHITEADRELEVIVFSNDADALDISVEDLQDGDTLSDGQHGQHGQHGQRQACDDAPDPTRGAGFVIKRLAIPALGPRDLVRPPKVTISRAPSRFDNDPPPPPVRFNLLVVAKTDLMLDGEVTTSGLSVGSDLLFSAVLSEYGLAWEHSGVSVRVDLFHPDGGVQTLHLERTAPGRYQKSLRSFRAGAYTAHFIAIGKSLLHHRTFRRECLRTIAVFPPSQCCSPEEPYASTSDSEG